MIERGGTLVIATRNGGKTKEFREAFGALGIEVKDLREIDGVPDIEETGTTFADNAFIKAKAVADIIKLPVLADDSGLCVDALDGAPGVYSARYSGEGATDAKNNTKLLRELTAAGASVRADGVPDAHSTARFVCALAMYDPADDSLVQVEGTIEGFILGEPRGEDGFGYDPLFWVPVHGKSMAELTVAEKNAISHRGNAIKKLIARLQS
ncbi:XTP/dITP diphosphatase [Cohnella yongneupensis]|uniref:dITP/XTP pyrophosphatase n=1 Tax=Cohnella yongneupensis TaxID=425006 RepID=A0ABW0QWP1_9BACL